MMGVYKMKFNKENVRTKNRTKFSQQIIILAILALAVVGVLVVNYVSSSALRDTVDIAVLTSSTAKDAYISESMLTKTTMVAAEYEKLGVVTMSDGTKRRQVVLWDDRDSVIGKYAANYIRGNTPIYYDELTAESAKSTSYLYQMDGELLKLDINPKDFGELIVPGDKLNIRVSYTDIEYKLPTAEEYKQQVALGIANDNITEVQKSELLFSEVYILDMLNSSGESIFDKYYELTSLPTSKQKEMYASDEFKKETTPASILISVTAEEADRYMSLDSKGIKSTQVTLLPRTSSNLILDAINSLSQGSSQN